jgi:hypothetical protein
MPGKEGYIRTLTLLRPSPKRKRSRKPVSLSITSSQAEKGRFSTAINEQTRARRSVRRRMPGSEELPGLSSEIIFTAKKRMRHLRRVHQGSLDAGRSCCAALIRKRSRIENCHATKIEGVS